MPKDWILIGYDWTLFRRLEPQMRFACLEGGVESLNLPDLMETLDLLDNPEPFEAACGAYLNYRCMRGEALECGQNLPEMIRSLRRHKNGEDAADLLGKLISSGSNLTEWMLDSGELDGLLTPAEVRELHFALNEIGDLDPPALPRGKLASIARRLLPGDDRYTIYEDLRVTVSKCAAEGWGIAAFEEGE